MCGLISMLWILFYWLICLFLCQYHTVLITMFCGIVWNQEVWCLQVCSFSGLLWLFRVFCHSIWILELIFISMKNAIGVFIWIVLNLCLKSTLIISSFHKLIFISLYSHTQVIILPLCQNVEMTLNSKSPLILWIQNHLWFSIQFCAALEISIATMEKGYRKGWAVFFSFILHVWVFHLVCADPLQVWKWNSYKNYIILYPQSHGGGCCVSSIWLYCWPVYIAKGFFPSSLGNWIQ